MEIPAVKKNDFDVEKVVRGFEKSARREALQKVKKNKTRNRDERPRRRDWQPLADDESADYGVLTHERIMPRDENERRRAVETRIQQRQNGGDQSNELAVSGRQGLVIEVSTGLCRVSVDGETILCAIRGSLTAHDTGFSNVVAVGDQVVIREERPGQGVVEAVQPRQSAIARPDPFRQHLRQVIAANVDQLLIVAAWRQPNVWPELIDRYLIAAQRGGVAAVLCINKIDLAGPPHEIEQVAGPYRMAGLSVLLTSAATGAGLGDLRAQLSGRITVLAGLSGVGKSSLLSAIEPGFHLRTGEVNEERGQGRHTTSQAVMLPFGADGYVIDTPGIREFGLYGLRRADLIGFYPEFAALASGCRFADCTHEREPDCAVREAVEDGRASAMRYDSYQKIRAGLPG